MTVRRFILGLFFALILQGVTQAQEPEAPLPAPALRPELDPFKDVRRADGTLRWTELLDHNTQEAGPRLRNFSLETFLRELTHVLKAGDRARTREFFQGVIATDFYTTYGVFAVSATAVELGYDMAYRRYLHRYISPRFASGMIRTNLALTTGIALAELVNGELQGKSFAISLGALGISSALVEAGANRIPALRRFKLAIKGKHASRLLKTGGFVYQTAELAVVFFVGRLIEEKFYAVRTEAQAHAALAKAGETVLAALPQAQGAAAAEAALKTWEAAWTEYRNTLFAPLLHDQQVFLSRLEAVAEEAKLADDRVQEALARAAKFPDLPVKGFLERQAAAAEAKFQRELKEISTVYLQSTQEHFVEIYQNLIRRHDLFFPAHHFLDADNRPQADRSFVRGHDRASRNRLQTYDHQLSAVRWLQRIAPQHAAALAASAERIERVKRADVRLLNDENSPLYLLGIEPEGDDAPEQTAPSGSGGGLAGELNQR